MIFARSHDPKDFFKIWKENCLIGQEEDPDQKILNLTESGENPLKSEIQNITLKNDLSTDFDDFVLPKSFSTKSSGTASKGLLGTYLYMYICICNFDLYMISIIFVLFVDFDDFDNFVLP